MGPLKFILAVGLMLAAAAPAEAQWRLFPNASWKKNTAPASDGECANGMCSLAQAAVSVAKAPVSVLRNVAESRPFYPSVSAKSGYGSSGGLVSSGGSSGEISVGTRFSDGSVVTSVGPLVSQARSSQGCNCTCPDCTCNTEQGRVCNCCCPDCVSNAPSSSLVAGAEGNVAGSLGGRKQFRESFLAAAQQAVEDGKLSREEYRRLSFRIKIPRIAAEMEAALSQQAVEDGAAGSLKDIDWNKLAAFLIKWLPEILKLFAISDSQPPQVPYRFTSPVQFVTAEDLFPVTI